MTQNKNTEEMVSGAVAALIAGYRNLCDTFHMVTFVAALLCLLLFSSSHAQVRHFTVLNTTDEHSTLSPLPMTDYHHEHTNPAMGGYSRLATLVREIREEKGSEPVLLFSTGDIVGGTPYAWLLPEGYSAEIEIMKKIGYDGMTIGNHEFDYGPELLAEYFLRAGYPEYNDTLALIASNLVIPDGHKLHEPGISKNRLYELPNGITVGVIGLLGREAYSVASFAEPVTVDDQHAAAARQVQILRDAGADIVLALTHSGIDEDWELAAAVDGIDIILGGHDHYTTTEPERVNNTIILHTGYYLNYLGKIEFEWNSETGELKTINDITGSPYLIALDSSIDEDPDILAMTDFYLEKLNEFVTGHTGGEFDDVTAPAVYSGFEMTIPGPFVETTVGNFVTDAMRIMGEQVTGERVDVAFQGNGIIRADIIPGTMEWSEGEISFFDLVTVSGLGTGPDGRAGYPLVSFYLTEREIMNVLEISSLLSQLMGDIYFLQVSGVRYTYDPGKATWLTIPFLQLPVPAYRSVVNAELYTGRGIQDDDNYIAVDRHSDKLYHVVTDYYLTSFLPMVGDILPRLGLVLKNKDGNPVTLEETIITRHGGEYKVWEAVAQYAASMEPGQSGMPEIPEYYMSTGERIVSEEGIPLRIWSYLLLIVVLVLIIFLVRLAIIKIKRRRRRQGAPS